MEFQKLENVLSEGILAAYLLGYDEAREENQEKLVTVRKETKISLSANFADGDDEKRAEKAGPIDLRFDVPPSEAIDYFKRKKVVTKKEFQRLSREAKAGAFYVSGIYKKDILEAFHREITDALASGQTSKYVVNEFKDILAGRGHRELGDFHLETIVRSNMMTAYGFGRRRAMEESADLLPFWEYSAVNDDRTRPTHRALDGLIYPANHEFWDTHFPPWGFNCRCTVIARLDMPENYNHERPNKDTKIAFDKDGLPAKAEYLTQVYDLKATKFVGVPRTSSLENVLEQTTKRVEQARRERDIYQTPKPVIDLAKKIRNETNEIAYLCDKSGKVLLSGTGTKDRFEMDVPDSLVPKLMGGINLHNHPPEAGRYYESFSLQDIVTAADWEFSETLVVTKNYLYSMRPPKSGWNNDLIEKIRDAYESFNDKILTGFYERFRSGELTKGQIKDIVRHKIWTLLAKEFGLRYKRKKI